jgi:hypothetical protein
MRIVAVQYMKYMNTFAFKRALSVGFTIFVACIMNYYFSFSKEAWIILAAWLVSQTTRGTPIRQAVLIFITMLVAILLSSWMLMHIKRGDIIYILSTIPLILCGYAAYFNKPQENKEVFFAILFSCIILFASLSPTKTVQFMHDRALDVMIGALIGVLAKWIVLPIRLDKEFSAGVLPILRSFKQYSQALSKNLLFFNFKSGIMLEKVQVEVALQDQQAMYPEWVYEVGFNRGLRSGFRFFLVSLERISEIFFSMNFIASRNIDPLLLNDIHADLSRSMQKNEELLTILIEYFEHNKLLDIQSDFTSDMTALEKTLNRVVPGNLELLDISPSNLHVTALVRDIRDMRTLLLQLVMALPVAATHFSGGK